MWVRVIQLLTLEWKLNEWRKKTEIDASEVVRILNALLFSLFTQKFCILYNKLDINLLPIVSLILMEMIDRWIIINFVQIVYVSENPMNRKDEKMKKKKLMKYDKFSFLVLSYIHNIPQYCHQTRSNTMEFNETEG